jgi:hypothetical protein
MKGLSTTRHPLLPRSFPLEAAVPIVVLSRLGGKARVVPRGTFVSTFRDDEVGHATATGGDSGLTHRQRGSNGIRSPFHDPTRARVLANRLANAPPPDAVPSRKWLR